MRAIIFPDKVNDQIGGKAQALASLKNTDLPIPAWFVVAPSAFWSSLMNDPVTTAPGTVPGAVATGSFIRLDQNTDGATTNHAGIGKSVFFNDARACALPPI